MDTETPFDPEERRREAMENGSGVSSYITDRRIGHVATTGSQETPQLPVAHKPHVTGHVQDFEGRPDIFRGGMSAPQTPEAQAAFQNVLPELRAALSDALITQIIEDVHEMIPIDRDNRAKSIT